MSGFLLGGFLTENGYSRQSFFIGLVIGIAIIVSGFLMNINLESRKILGMGCCDRTKHNCSKLFCEGLTTKELTLSLIFFILLGILIPTYAEFMYYYQITVAEFSKFTYAMLRLVSFGGIFLGSIIFNLLLKNLSIRVTMTMTCFAFLFSSVG